MLFNLILLYLGIGLGISIYNIHTLYFNQEAWDEIMRKVPDVEVVRLYLGTTLFLSIIVTACFLLTILIWPYEFIKVGDSKNGD